MLYRDAVFETMVSPMLFSIFITMMMLSRHYGHAIAVALQARGSRRHSSHAEGARPMGQPFLLSAFPCLRRRRSEGA